MTPIPEHSVQVRRAADLAIGSRGLTREAIGHAIGVGPKYAGRLLAVAKRQGLVDSICTSTCEWLWLSPEAAQRMRDELVAARVKRNGARNRLRAEARRRSRGIKPRAAKVKPAEQPKPELEREPDDDPIVRRVGVSASAPLPFVCRAPASVFHLGAAS